MDVARVAVTGSKATAELLTPVTTGMVGATVSITYDGEWDSLNKQVLFRRGNNKVMQATGSIIPHEILTSPYETLFVGVYGFTSDGTIVIPTVWAKICEIRQGVDPEGDESADPTSPVYLQLTRDIGDLKQLNTNTKESLVAAVNELTETLGIINLYVCSDGEYTADGTPAIDKPEGSTAYLVPQDSEGTLYASWVYANGAWEFVETLTVTLDETEGGEGLSPYEIAVKNGFEGSEKEWLESLKGPKGDTGAQGPKGDTGYTPQKGIDYYTDADKQEMVNAVIAALPVYDGEVEAV